MCRISKVANLRLVLLDMERSEGEDCFSVESEAAGTEERRNDYNFQTYEYSQSFPVNLGE